MCAHSNPLNEGKPVRISRDGQELSAEAGQRLLALFGDYGAQQGAFKGPNRYTYTHACIVRHRQ